MRDPVVTSVKGDSITVRDVINRMKLKGTYRSTIYDLIEEKVIEVKIEELNSKPSADEISVRVAEKRRLAGLSREQDFENYIKYHGITATQIESFWRVQSYRDTLKETVITEEQIKKFYHDNKERYVTAAVARLAFRSRQMAAESLRKLQSGEENFFDMARNYSIDESTRFGGGYLGNIRRGFLLKNIESEVFSADPETVIGPFSENNVSTIYKVYALNKPKLADSLKSMIRNQLFEEWMKGVVCSFPA